MLLKRSDTLGFQLHENHQAQKSLGGGLFDIEQFSAAPLNATSNGRRDARSIHPANLEEKFLAHSVRPF